jgi:hypothetical protein
MLGLLVGPIGQHLEIVATEPHAFVPGDVAHGQEPPQACQRNKQAPIRRAMHTHSNCLSHVPADVGNLAQPLVEDSKVYV